MPMIDVDRMAFYKLLVFITCLVAVAYSEDCVYTVKHKNKEFLFDLISHKNLQTINFTKNNDSHIINIILCDNSETKSTCDGIRSKIHVCLIRKHKNQADIGSKIKEIKLNEENQLVMILEGNTFCEKNKKHQTDLTFICSKSITESKIIYKSSYNCKHIIEVYSITACPVDDLDIRKSCTLLIPHNNYNISLSPLRRHLTTNYLVENQNRRFEVNICGRLTDINKCGGNITTICDVTDEMNAKIYAVGCNKNDKLFFDNGSRNLKLIQYERSTSRNKGRRIEIVFKCNESITPEKTKPEFLNEYYNPVGIKSSVAHFEIATSTVCIPRRTSCEIFKDTARYNLKPLHKRVGNWLVINYINGGKFYLNVCDYLNQYGEEIPKSCSVDRITSACYVNSSGIGISIGSSQIGPHFVENSLLLSYTDGESCQDSLRWSTIIYFICSDKSELIHVSTNFTSCTFIFQWKSREACNSLLTIERKNDCMVRHPRFNTIYNLNDLKNQNFEVNDDSDMIFRFSICSPLQTPCNGIVDSAACFSINGNEINIGLMTEEIVFDNGKIYMSMQGEKCDDSGPNSYTIIRFVCDYSNSKGIEMKKDLQECFFEFFIFTKHACTQNLKTNCTVNDKLGNVYDLSKLTKLNSNYEITINQMQTIILNICHSVINNDINGTNCQLYSGICLINQKDLSPSSRYKNLGDVNKSPYKVENKIILEMKNGYYDHHSVSSVIEFICLNKNNNGYPLFVNEINHTFTFKWHTPLVCPNYKQQMKKEIVEDKPDHVHEAYNNPTATHPRMETITELRCSVSSYDLRPLKGNYLVINEKTKYYINMCMPGEDNGGGEIEFNGKNHSIGYQGKLKIDKDGKVNVHFMNGDWCNLVKSGSPRTYSTKIQLICSSTERNPIVINTKNKCALEFLWETSHVCDKIMLEFNECKREAYVIGYNKNFENSKTINMKNILNTTEFFDKSTQIWFYLNFCNASVYLNKLTFSLMHFQYDVNKNQLNAYFKNITNIGFSSVNITIACSKKFEDLSMPIVKITNDEVKLSMYSKELCCMGGYTYINEELCRNVPSTNILTSTISSINTEENELSINFQKYDYDPSEIHLEESDLLYENKNAISDHQFYETTTAVLVDHFADKPSAKKDKSGSSFYIGVMIMVLLLISLLWFYRWKLLKEIRKLLYILLSARRRERYSRNLMEMN